MKTVHYFLVTLLISLLASNHGNAQKRAHPDGGFLVMGDEKRQRTDGDYIPTIQPLPEQSPAPDIDRYVTLVCTNGYFISNVPIAILKQSEYFGNELTRAAQEDPNFTDIYLPKGVSGYLMKIMLDYMNIIAQAFPDGDSVSNLDYVEHLLRSYDSHFGAWNPVEYGAITAAAFKLNLPAVYAVLLRLWTPSDDDTICTWKHGLYQG